MAITDIGILEEQLDNGNVTTSYTGAVKSYFADTLYLLAVGSQDNVSPAKPSTAPTTTGLTWLEVASLVGTNEQLTLYKAVPTASFSAATTVTFDSNQEDCAWNIIQVFDADTTGVNGANAIAASETEADLATTDWANTLAAAVDAGNAVIAMVWQDNSTAVFTAGTGMVPLTSEALGRHGFVMYNLTQQQLTEATSTISNDLLGIVAVVEASAAPELINPTLKAESNTELSGTVDCSTNGDDLYWYISLSAVRPSITELKAGTGTYHVDNGTQAISASGEQTIASFGSSYDPATAYYVYYVAEDANGDSNVVGTGPVTLGGVVTVHTLELIDKTTVVTAGSFVVDERYEILVPGTTDFTLIGAANSDIGTVFTATGVGVGDGTAYHIIPCICESTDFALGVTAELWPAGVEGNKEVSASVVAIDTAPTANPQYNVTFSAAPDSGASDQVNIIYDATVGDIKSVTGGIALASDAGFTDATHTC